MNRFFFHHPRYFIVVWLTYGLHVVPAQPPMITVLAPDGDRLGLVTIDAEIYRIHTEGVEHIGRHPNGKPIISTGHATHPLGYITTTDDLISSWLPYRQSGDPDKPDKRVWIPANYPSKYGVKVLSVANGYALRQNAHGRLDVFAIDTNVTQDLSTCINSDVQSAITHGALQVTDEFIHIAVHTGQEIYFLKKIQFGNLRAKPILHCQAMVGGAELIAMSASKLGRRFVCTFKKDAGKLSILYRNKKENRTLSGLTALNAATDTLLTAPFGLHRESRRVSHELTSLRILKGDTKKSEYLSLTPIHERSKPNPVLLHGAPMAIASQGTTSLLVMLYQGKFHAHLLHHAKGSTCSSALSISFGDYISNAISEKDSSVVTLRSPLKKRKREKEEDRAIEELTSMAVAAKKSRSS